MAVFFDMLKIGLTNQKSAFFSALALLAMLFSGQQATGATTDKAEKMLCSLERVHNNFGKGTKGFYASVELSDFTIFERDKAKPENLYSKLERKFNPFMNIYALQSPYPLRMSRIDLFQDGKLASRGVGDTKVAWYKCDKTPKQILAVLDNLERDKLLAVLGQDAQAASQTSSADLTGAPAKNMPNAQTSESKGLSSFITKILKPDEEIPSAGNEAAHEIGQSEKMVCTLEKLAGQSWASSMAEPAFKPQVKLTDYSIFDSNADGTLDFRLTNQNNPFRNKSNYPHAMSTGKMLKDGRLIVSKLSGGTMRAWYKCDKTPKQILAALDKLERDKLLASLGQDAQVTSQTSSETVVVSTVTGQVQPQVSVVDEPPKITISSVLSQGPQGVISGRVTGSAKIAELRIDGQIANVDSNGNFKVTTYVPQGGASVNIEVVDINAQSSTMSVRMDRAAAQIATVSFDRLNPLGRKVAPNTNALALIIGVDSYKSTSARAIYADSDAQVFSDYATQKLGISPGRIKTLVNDGAGEREMLLSVKSWLSRSVKQNQSDVYIFFAGHGLASDDGSKMYLLPYDGAPELLDDTAILRDRLFSDVAAANPRSVTVFLDTCYSGTTRGTDMLIASRPIAIRAIQQAIPDNFTVMTAAAGDQTAKPLLEAKHGMFSYFLMKGMEGEADANNDNEITAGELHSYVQTNVIQQSSGTQTPELQGDADRVLVRFQ